MSEESKPIAPVGASGVVYLDCPECGRNTNADGNGHICHGTRELAAIANLEARCAHLNERGLKQDREIVALRTALRDGVALAQDFADFYRTHGGMRGDAWVRRANRADAFRVRAAELLAGSIVEDAALAALKAELESCRASLSTAEKENTRQRGEVERLRGQLKESHRRHTEAEALLADANGLNTRLQEEAALYKQRYQEKAAESQTWAAKAGAHAAENTPLQEALRELLRLYDWRFGLAEREKDPERTGEHYRETQRLLRQYGAEKKAAWSAARSVLPGEAHVDGTRSDNTSFRPLADAALAAPKASEIASDSTALEKALGALRAARDELDAATIALCAHSQPMVPRTVIEQWLSPIRRTLSGGAHVDALKAQKDQADQANPEPR